MDKKNANPPNINNEKATSDVNIGDFSPVSRKCYVVRLRRRLLRWEMVVVGGGNDDGKPRAEKMFSRII